jgi:hypothetical protein
MSEQDLEAILRGPQSKIISIVGIAGLAILLWLMVFKPGG